MSGLGESDRDVLSAAADLDRFAWQAICDWPNHSAVEVVRDRLDYGALTRYFLWDKVPRAIRRQANPGAFAFEQALLDQSQHRSQHQRPERLAKAASPPLSRWEEQVKQPLRRSARIAGLRLRHVGHSVVFIPRVHPQLDSTLAALSNSSSLRLVAPFDPGNTSLKTFQVLPRRLPDVAFAEQLYQGILRGLGTFGIELLTSDRSTLRHQILAQSHLIPQIEAELLTMRPQAVLVFADNHMPSQEYVAIANRQSIPTIMLQHGLDCEQYCLSEAYASAIAVWGEARQQRYQKDAKHPPHLIQVTGNPRYDHFRLPQQLCPSGDQWLWVTRPHRPEKCYLPSRLPQEGLDILRAILAALKQNQSAQLTIKPHPFDYSDLYAQEIEKHQMSDRVTITHSPLPGLLSQANLAIAEDSTAAMEAMFFGKIVIHAHFARSPPVLPLVDYNAALPANSAETLQASLIATKSLTDQKQRDMLQGQHDFIRDYAGALDGKASQRVNALITQTIGRKDG